MKERRESRYNLDFEKHFNYTLGCERELNL